MSELREVFSDYVRVRRSLGFVFDRDARELERFVDFLEQVGARRITVDLALTWARMPATAHPSVWRKRLWPVRGFARYLATLDPESEIPPPDLLPAHQPRIAPYIYSPQEITALMLAARSLKWPLRAATFETVIGLLASTGLRLREALALERDEVDLREGVLLAGTAKHNRREVVLHPSATAALARYTALRDDYCPNPPTPAFFITTRGRPLTKPVFWSTFSGLIKQAGLDGRGQRVRPRAHDIRHTFAVRTLLGWYQDGELPSGAAHSAGARMTLLAPTLQAFFTQRLISQRDASPRTIASYRDTFRLLLAFVQEHTGKAPYQLDFADLDAPMIGAFLTHLEHDRGNTARTRNNRLAAIHSLYRYAALEHPEHAATIARVIAIPPKRYQRKTISYLDANEIKALLRAPDPNTWLGRRDHALLLLAIQTGLRVSEITALTRQDLTLQPPAHIRVHGKGRKDRAVTLTRETVQVLKHWLAERQGEPHDPAFPTREGRRLSRDAVERLLAKHTTTAATRCPSIQTKHITPHGLRHTNAMLLRANNNDLATIALWLGHESTRTTNIYEHPDPTVKEQAIARTAPLGARPGRYRPTDALLAFLESL